MRIFISLFFFITCIKSSYSSECLNELKQILGFNSVLNETMNSSLLFHLEKSRSLVNHPQSTLKSPEVNELLITQNQGSLAIESANIISINIPRNYVSPIILNENLSTVLAHEYGHLVFGASLRERLGISSSHKDLAEIVSSINTQINTLKTQIRSLDDQRRSASTFEMRVSLRRSIEQLEKEIVALEKDLIESTSETLLLHNHRLTRYDEFFADLVAILTPLEYRPESLSRAATIYSKEEDLYRSFSYSGNQLDEWYSNFGALYYDHPESTYKGPHRFFSPAKYWLHINVLSNLDFQSQERKVQVLNRVFSAIVKEVEELMNSPEVYDQLSAFERNQKFIQRLSQALSLSSPFRHSSN